MKRWVSLLIILACLLMVADPARATIGDNVQTLLDSLAVGVIAIAYDKPKVTSAIIDNGVVRVTNEQPYDVRVFLHAIALSGRGNGPLGGVTVDLNTSTVTGLGIGYAWSFENITFSAAKDFKNLALGIGIIWDLDYSRLASGYEDGKPPPNPNRTDVPIRKESVTAPFFLVSYSFGGAK